jgi:hypothetical protein
MIQPKLTLQWPLHPPTQPQKSSPPHRSQRTSNTREPFLLLDPHREDTLSNLLLDSRRHHRVIFEVVGEGSLS